MVLSPRRIYRKARSEENGKQRVGNHLLAARTLTRDEDGPAEYVARLDLSECIRILAASPVPLSTLAVHAPASRVSADEERGFEEVVRYWTLWVQSAVERD